jgi:hypothetical protein
MKLILENWRDYMKEIEGDQYAVALNSPVYIFNTNNINSILENKTQPNRKISLKEFLHDVEKGIISEQKAMDIFASSMSYEREALLQEMLNEGLLDWLKVTYDKAKSKGSEYLQKVAAKVLSARNKIMEKWIAFNVKLFVGALGILEKILKTFSSARLGLSNLVTGFVTRILKLVGISNPTQRQIMIGTVGLFVAVTLVTAAIVAAFDAGTTGGGVHKLIQVGQQGGEIQGLCETLGLSGEDKVLFESMCADLAQNTPPEKVMSVCMEEMGANQAIDGSMSQLMKVSGGEGGGYTFFAESDQFQQVVSKIGQADQVVSYDKFNYSLLGESVEGVSEFSTRSAETLQVVKAKLLAANSPEEITKVLSWTTEQEKSLLAKSMQWHAKLKEAAPGEAATMEALGSKVEVVSNFAVEAETSLVEELHTITKAGKLTKADMSSTFMNKSLQAVRKFFRVGK